MFASFCNMLNVQITPTLLREKPHNLLIEKVPRDFSKRLASPNHHWAKDAMGTDWFVANEVAVGGGTCCMEKLMHAALNKLSGSQHLNVMLLVKREAPRISLVRMPS